MSWLGIDTGKRRSGVAISWSGELTTPYGLIVGPLENQARQIAMVVAKEHIHTVVLGRPRRELPATHPTLVLLKHLKHELHSRELAAEIAVIDETLTTKEAERLAGPTQNTDTLAAQLILEQYLREQEEIDAQ